MIFFRKPEACGLLLSIISFFEQVYKMTTGADKAPVVI